MTVLLVALGAAVGAPLRYLIAKWYDDRLPWGTLAVNVLGSFVLGVAVGRGLTGDAAALVMTGFCGGLTTYSTFAVQTRDHSRGQGTVYAAATIGLGLAAAFAGYALAVL